jgi:hypothetical protein
MASWKPELHDKEGVMNYYEQFDSPYFNLYAGNKVDEPFLRWDFQVNDKARGREVLSDALESILANPNNNNTYLLQILMEEPKEPKRPGARVSLRGRGKPLSKQITFQLNNVGVSGLMPYYPGQMVGGVPGGNSSELKTLIAQNSEMLEIIKTRLLDQDEEPEEQNANLGFVGQVLNNPTYAPLIEAAIVGLISKILPQNTEPGKVAGVPDQAQSVAPPTLEETMNNLAGHGMTYNDLLGLERFARRNPLQFKMYLNILRKQF